MMKRITTFAVSVILAACSFLAVSCGAPKQISYFQDALVDTLVVRANEIPIRLSPGDKVSIVVNCSDPMIMNLFNLPYISGRLGQTSEGTGSTQGISGYTLDKNGQINFPCLGLVTIGGMTREEVASFITSELVGQNLVKDPVVTVEYQNLAISVLGEVNHQGRYTLPKDNITIIDALSMAGDLTIQGKRDNVLVIRNENGVRKTYTVDLTSLKDVFSSPVFYLQQNDIVYVEPNDKRARESTVNGNNVRSASFWVSAASLGTSIASFIVALIMNKK